MPSQISSNQLRAAMTKGDCALLAPSFEAVDLDLRKEIELADTPITHAYFPDSGMISVVATQRGGHKIEAGLIGREGMSAISVVIGNHKSPNESYVQAAGAGHRIAVDDLRAAMAASATLQPLLLRYVQAFMVQVTQTALANGRSKVEERLARWLLMADDRLKPHDVILTQEFIALMLGVRRPGVTDAMHQLESRGLIRSQRMNIRIVDREGLEEMAAGAYGVPEAEYRRLIDCA